MGKMDLTNLQKVDLNMWLGAQKEGLVGRHSMNDGAIDYKYEGGKWRFDDIRHPSKLEALKYWGKFKIDYYLIMPKMGTKEYIKFWDVLFALRKTHTMYVHQNTVQGVLTSFKPSWWTLNLKYTFSFKEELTTEEFEFLKQFEKVEETLKMKVPDMGNLCKEIAMPAMVEPKNENVNKGHKMENVLVEVKVNGEAVGTGKEAVVKTPFEDRANILATSYYTNGEVSHRNLEFKSKKEAKAWLQEPKHLGCTLVIYRAESILETNIPVVEKKA